MDRRISIFVFRLRGARGIPEREYGTFYRHRQHMPPTVAAADRERGRGARGATMKVSWPTPPMKTRLPRLGGMLATTAEFFAR
jgi:hypothetical protein